MLSRGSSGAYICLQCRHRLSLRSSLPRSSTSSSLPVRSPSIQATNHRRWQSSVVARVHEDDAGDEDGNEHPIWRPVHDSRPLRKDGTEFPPRPPPQTEKLGIERLGEPAEIILLPKAGHRKNFEEPEEEEGTGETIDKPQLSIRDALAKEARPVALAEIFSSIDRIKEEMNQLDDPRSLGSRTKYTDALLAGFSRTQLYKYYVSKVKDNHLIGKARGALAGKSQPPGKSKVVDAIMTNIWGFEDRNTSQDHRTKVMAFEPATYKVLVMAGVIGKCKSAIPGALVVKDNFANTFTISGAESCIKKAHRFLVDYAEKELVSQPLKISRALTAAIFVDENSSRHRDPRVVALRRRLMEEDLQKRKTALAQHPEGVVSAIAPSNWHTSHAQRDLIFEGARLAELNDLPEPISPAALADTSTVPLLNLMPTRQSNSYDFIHWERRVANPALPSPGHVSSSSELAEHPIDKVIAQLLPFQLSPLSETSANISGKQVELDKVVKALNKEFSLELGQAVSWSDAGDAALVQAFLRSRIPMLEHFLAAREPSGSNEISSQLVRLDDPEKQLLEFTLRKMAWEPESLIIRLYAQPETDDRGKFSTLKILEVSISFDAGSRMLALPDMPIDLNLSREDKCVIFRQGQKMEPQYAPLMASLASQLIAGDGKNKAPDELAWSPNIELDLSCFSTKPGVVIEKPKAGHKSSASPTHTAEFAVDHRSLNRVVYDLSDVKGHCNASAPLFLEHVAYSGSLKTATPTEERWRFVTTPILHDWTDNDKDQNDTTELASADVAQEPSLSLPTPSSTAPGQKEQPGRDGPASTRQRRRKSEKSKQPENEAEALDKRMRIGDYTDRFKVFIRGSYDIVTNLNTFVEEKTAAMRRLAGVNEE